jgi:peptidoglycan/xylan/chitin deacetylase (PgdA/CDA1 family)
MNGEHAKWHPQITKEVVEAGMTIGTLTWSHKDLERKSYASDFEQANKELEMGFSAVHMAAGSAVLSIPVPATSTAASDLFCQT